MERDLIFETLHCHTLLSDGQLTYEQVLDECLKNKIKVVAFTDHDLLPKAEVIARLKSLSHPVKFLTGIEISCDLLAEIDEKVSLHVTGLFVDPTNKSLIDFSHRQLEFRHRRMTEYVKRLSSLGFKISEADVLRQVSGKAIGQPHIVAALAERPENWELLDKFFEELVEAAKADPLRKKQLEEISARGEGQKWYVLVMSKEALHSVYVDYFAENPVSLDEAVNLIRGAGGVAMIAHWSYLRDIVTFEVLEKLVREKRIDGMETVYAFGNEFNQDLFLSDMEKLSQICQRSGLIEGGGGDFHRAEDFALMVDPRFAALAQKTKGLLEKILEKHTHINLNWSTLS